jgi:hypothetical protein
MEPVMRIRSDLDQLIDWYEQHCLIVGRVIAVIAAPTTIAKFARKGRRGGPYIYRNCEIVPLRRSKRTRRESETKQTEFAHGEH